MLIVKIVAFLQTHGKNEISFLVVYDFDALSE